MKSCLGSWLSRWGECLGFAADERGALDMTRPAQIIRGGPDAHVGVNRTFHCNQKIDSRSEASVAQETAPEPYLPTSSAPLANRSSA
jgi:hypothetical protein